MATVPSARTWANRDPLSTTNLNTGVRDPITFALAPPMARLRATSAQTLASSTAAAILFDTEDLDTVNGHSTSANTSRYTAVYAGWYQFSGGIEFAANGTGRRACWWRKNGSDVSGTESVIVPHGTGNIGVVARTVQILLGVNDYVELVGFQDSGGNLNTSVAVGPQHASMDVRWVAVG